MCYEEAKIKKVFRAILGLVLSVYLILLMFYVALDECILIEIGTGAKIFIWIVEGLFAVDFVLNFLAVPPNMSKPRFK